MLLFFLIHIEQYATIKKHQCRVNNLYIPARMVKDKNNLLRKKKHLKKKICSQRASQARLAFQEMKHFARGQIHICGEYWTC